MAEEIRNGQRWDGSDETNSCPEPHRDADGDTAGGEALGEEQGAGSGDGVVGGGAEPRRSQGGAESPQPSASRASEASGVPR